MALGASNTFVTPSAAKSLALSRIDFNDSMQALLQCFYSAAEPAPANIVFTGTAQSPIPDGVLYRSSTTGALYISDSNYQKGNPVHGSNMTRYGISHRIEDSLAAADYNTYEIGEIFATVGANARMYMISSNTGPTIVDIGIPATGTVDTAQLAEGAVTVDKMDPGAANTRAILNGAVTENKIDDGAVTVNKIGTGAVTGVKIAMGSDARGDILYRGASNYQRLAKGTNGQLLQMGANDPAWSSTAVPSGTETLYVPAGAMIPRTTNGPSSNLIELATNDVMRRTLDYSPSTIEAAQFSIAMPKRWNEGTFNVQIGWTAAASSGTVSWRARALSVSDNDPMDATWGTQISLTTDTFLSVNDLHITTESNPVTPGGAIAEGDEIIFEIDRNTADTLATDAKLLWAKVTWTSDSGNDD